MRSFALAALVARCALANPVPQEGFDWDAIDALDPIPTPVIPVVDAASAQTTLPYTATAAAAEVSASVLADPTNTSLKQRSTVNNTQCSVQPSSDDTAENFLSNTAFSSAANDAQTPAGYSLVYIDQPASSQGVYGYMGYSILNSYDVKECSKRCDALQGCQSINVYFERDPTVDQEGCTDPPSTTVIKCVYYGGPVTPASATNDGQWRRDFHVVIAGSNGYVNNSIATPAGYQTPVFLDKSAINAPADCNKKDTYMGVKTFSGVFDIGKCAAACSAQSAYNQKHPAKNGFYQTCQFFNTYVLYNDTTAVGQYCALYNESWPATFATNNGQWRGPNYFNIGFSYAGSNTTGSLDQPQGCANPTQPK